MENKTIAENTYDALATMMHQGKSIEQWAKDFKGEFTMPQLVRMAKGGCDLQKMLLQQDGVLSVDESEEKEEVANESSAEDEEAALNEEDEIEIETISDLIDELNEITTAPNSTSIVVHDLNENPLAIAEVVATPKAVILKTKNVDALEESNEKIDEALFDASDVVTVSDFIKYLNQQLVKDDDKIMFRCNKKECSLFDVHSKNGVAVVDLVPGKMQFNEDDE